MKELSINHSHVDEIKNRWHCLDLSSQLSKLFVTDHILKVRCDDSMERNNIIIVLLYNAATRNACTPPPKGSEDRMHVTVIRWKSLRNHWTCVDSWRCRTNSNNRKNLFFHSRIIWNLKITYYIWYGEN